MSYAAINDVTRGIRQLLHSQLVRASSSAVVSLLPPGDSLPQASGVNVYLYRVSESPYTKNQPWPGDRTTPPSAHPALGLQLHYLLTPLGTQPDNTNFTQGDDAHTMLGLAMLTLQENPILNDVHLPALPASGSLNATEGFDADLVLPPYLLNSFEQIKIMLSPIGIEEISKIWATINQPYRLSVAYEVSLVEITPTPPPPVQGGIVLQTDLVVLPLQAPLLDSLSPAIGPLVHIDSSGTLQPNTLSIDGSGLSFPDQTPVVTVGGQPASILTGSPPGSSSLAVSLPSDLAAGPQVDVTVTVNGRTSTPLTLMVSPWLASSVPVRTGLPAGQKLNLAGVGFTGSPAGVRFDGLGAPSGLTPFDPGVGDAGGSISPPSSLPNGLYQVRVVLGDAAHSASNSRSLEIIPRIDTVSVAAGSPPGAGSVLTINGARLNGSDVRLSLDGVVFVAPPNSNPVQFVQTLNRVIDPGSHSVALSVDGHTSHTVDLEV